MSRLVRLWEVCGLTRPWNDPFKDIERKVIDDPEGLLVLDVDGQVVGSSWSATTDTAGGSTTSACPEHRRAGHGREPVRRAEERLQALGCAKVNLQVRTESEAALGFYQRSAFDETRSRASDSGSSMTNRQSATAERGRLEVPA